ncbi:MAG: PadR family transcriptional regulator [Aphanothece sp. CMT-3BRIN-NPC111]|jgi:DNA-binding PadR family transcriptional regulator|nr:PadR family transcriptional regulator [Aphanothece sp. CMT-3BRIN-NPC111]
MAIAHAILAFLIDFPCSGYDLAKQFDGSVGFFWKASHQQIYRELAKLEDQGWLSCEAIVQEGRPDKKLYCVTDLGRKQLLEWMAQPTEPTPSKEAILVKIFAGYLVPRHTLVKELERHRQAHLEKLSIYQDLEQQYFQNPEKLPIEAKFRYLTLLRGIGFETDWVAWCDRAIQLLSQPENEG